MTDKVQKIRQEVEKLKSQLLRGACSSQIAMETRCKEEAYNEVLAILDTMQEQHVKESAEIQHEDKSCEDNGNSLTKEPTSWLDEFRAKLDSLSKEEFEQLWGKYGAEEKEELVSEDLDDYINELSKQFPEVSFAKLSRIAVRVSRWQRNQDVKNKLPKVINRTDLDEFAYQCAYDMSNDWAIENPTWHDVEGACKLGAKWQKDQYQSTIELAEDHAMLAGMEKEKEGMMAKAIDGKIYETQARSKLKAVTTGNLSRLDYKVGDKVKVIIIKED